LLLQLANLALTSNNSKILDNLLGVLSLTSTGLTSDKHGLVLMFVQHCTVCLISNGEHVRRLLITTTTTIAIDSVVVVDGESLVGVENHKEKTTVSVDNITVVTDTKVVKNASLVQVTELGAIFHTIELGRVTFKGVLLLDSESGSITSLNGDIITAFLDNFTTVVCVLVLGIRVEPNIVLTLGNSEKSLRATIHKIPVEVFLCSVI
jgi:hypothetical protein